jgi:phosphatidylinositol glycan class H protein
MPPHLSVCRPSPTTVFFSVSNAASRSSITAKLIFYLEVTLRTLVFAFILLVIAAKTRHLTAQDGIVPWDNIWSSTIGTVACHIAGDLNWLLIATGSGLGIYLVFRKGYIGVQLNFQI